MGTGKTTVGSAAARIAGVPFIDLDQEIRRYAQKSISDIFTTMGEAYFRRLESELLETFLRTKGENYVVATGGGAVLAERNRMLMCEHSFVVQTSAAREEIIRRLNAAQDERPLLRGNLVEQVGRLLEQRRTLYNFANITIYTDQMQIDTAAASIIKAWHDYSTLKREQ